MRKDNIMSPIATVQHYFDLSNNRNLEKVFKLFALEATYSSDNTGLYFGISDIRDMMQNFFDNYPKLHWEIHSIQETTSQIVELNFTLRGTDTQGEKIIRPGIERIVVVDEHLRHIEVRNT